MLWRCLVCYLLRSILAPRGGRENVFAVLTYDLLHVHFNGAGGNIGAGKYNDGDKENRMILANRVADAMQRASQVDPNL